MKLDGASSTHFLQGNYHIIEDWLRVCFLTFFKSVQGLLGSVQSGRSALVNRYVTGSYLPLEKIEGKHEKLLSCPLRPIYRTTPQSYHFIFHESLDIQ